MMRLLDLFCGAGGSAMGYSRAGFTEIVGVDNRPMPRYPFTFVLGDALEYVAEHGHEFDAIHASPPCQGYGNTYRIMRGNHPMLIGETRKLLVEIGKPYVIENVRGAPLINPTTLVGTMFGLLTMRPRLFECSFYIPFELAPPRHANTTKMGRRPKHGNFIHVVGHNNDIEYCKKVMGIDWMSGDELSEAIPPAYTEYIGKHLIEYIARNKQNV